MARIIIFGMGAFAQELFCNKKKDTEVLAFLVTEDAEPGIVDNIPVIGIGSICEFEYDYIIIAFSDIEKGISKLHEVGVDDSKIVCYSFSGFGLSDGKVSTIHKQAVEYAHLILKDEMIPKLFNIEKKSLYLCTMNSFIDSRIVTNDFVREQTLFLIAKEIERKGIDGYVAEVGVFKGEFAWKINSVFPERSLYLFDTFSGFDKRDINDSNENDSRRRFSNDDIAEVIGKMPYPDMCVIKKGYFPDTFDVDGVCVFVDIDADLYNPVIRALEVFYQILAPGGYIMIHDYNNIIFADSHNAVLDYCEKEDISFVPLPDVCGSVVITK